MLTALLSVVIWLSLQRVLLSGLASWADHTINISACFAHALNSHFTPPILSCFFVFILQYSVFISICLLLPWLLQNVTCLKLTVVRKEYRGIWDACTTSCSMEWVLIHGQKDLTHIRGKNCALFLLSHWVSKLVKGVATLHCPLCVLMVDKYSWLQVWALN